MKRTLTRIIAVAAISAALTQTTTVPASSFSSSIGGSLGSTLGNALGGAVSGVRGKPGTPEALLAQAVGEIQHQHFDSALAAIDNLIKMRPDFRLAYLIRGDLLLAKARPLEHIGEAPQASAGRIEDFREEAVARLRAYHDQPDPNLVPRYLLRMQPGQQYAIVVDTTRARLYLYRNDNGTPRYVSDYYITSGKEGAQKTREGDMKTPIGIYHVTSSLPAKKLPDFYGSGAFPLNYPNEWDRRMGRDGHGIWLHGVPVTTYSRPPRASDGCVVLSNADLDTVARHLQIGLTPVIISDEVQWVSPAEWASERDDFMGQLESWRADWESRDTGRYLSHYSTQFQSGTESYAAFMRHKQLVNSGKQWVKVELGDVSVFRDPGRDDLIEVTFDQSYRSNNLVNVMKKRQYWKREAHQWRIVYEGAA
jgi:murein L,D-transpeptidase YafK